MKFLVVAALLGAISAKPGVYKPKPWPNNEDTVNVWDLNSVKDHRDDQAVQKAYGDHSIKSANARPPYRSSAQIADSEDSSSDSESSDDQEI